MSKEKFMDSRFGQYFFIGLGSAIMALGIGVFMVDAKVVPGGVSGLSIAVHYLTGGALPVGMLMWVMNIPLYIWGLKELGKTFGVRTFYAFTLNSFFIDMFRGDIPGLGFIRLQDMPAVVELLQHDFLFFVLIGAVLLGVGLGIIFKFRGTTAGSDIVASIMQKRAGFKPGQAIMIIDFFVITFAGIVIGMNDISPERSAMTLTFYAFLSLYLSSKIIDVIIDGFDYARVAYIISEKSDDIGKLILNDMGRGATAYKTRGLYTNQDREVLMVVCSVKEVSTITEEIRAIDPNAFIIISNVHEVMGKGFRRRI